MEVYKITVSEVYLPIVTYLNVRKVKISFSLALLCILFSPCKKGLFCLKLLIYLAQDWLIASNFNHYLISSTHASNSVAGMLLCWSVAVLCCSVAGMLWANQVMINVTSNQSINQTINQSTNLILNELSFIF